VAYILGRCVSLQSFSRNIFKNGANLSNLFSPNTFTLTSEYNMNITYFEDNDFKEPSSINNMFYSVLYSDGPWISIGTENYSEFLRYFSEETTLNSQSFGVHDYYDTEAITYRNDLTESPRYWYINDLGEAPPPVQVDFYGVPISGLSPLVVQFYDQSSGGPTSWDWDFGDGSPHSTMQNPIHTYTGSGSYTITLTANNSFSSDSETKENYIRVFNTYITTVLPNGGGFTRSYGPSIIFD
jgi:PKD repeat protein